MLGYIYLKYLQSGPKFEPSISNDMWPHVSRSKVGLHVQFFWLRTWIIYIYISYVEIFTHFRYSKVLEYTISWLLSESNMIHPEYYFLPNNEPKLKYCLEDNL